jgi:hypothetical protein
MPKRSAASAVCPRPGHEESRVRFDGTYGSPGHRRQRYKCTPTNGEQPHVFTDVMPREQAWRDACDACERHVAAHEGPQAPREHLFVARGIAQTLLAVGTGLSYMRASRSARERAGRVRFDPKTGRALRSVHGQLAADWVEVFAPVVFEPHRKSDWPATGTLVLDHLPFRVRAFYPNGRAIPGGKVAFDVFCAMGYENGTPRLWRLEAFTDAGAANWRRFLSSLDGAPPRVVCDSHSGMLQAISSLWPQTDIYLCEWHLRHALERLLRNQGRKYQHHATSVSVLLPRVEAAFAGLSFWQPFVRDCRASAIPALDDWLDKMDPVIQEQFRRRGRRRPDMPRSTGGLETLTRPIRDALHPRRYALKNRQRTNHLLMLMQLHANGDDSELDYTSTIRDWLITNGGRPRVLRRAVTDPLGAPSLRR